MSISYRKLSNSDFCRYSFKCKVVGKSSFYSTFDADIASSILLTDTLFDYSIFTINRKQLVTKQLETNHSKSGLFNY